MDIPDYLFGLATLPAVAASGVVLWQAGRLVNRAGDAVVKRLPLTKVENRAGFAAFAACTRRCHVFTFAGIVVAVAAGYDGSQARKVYDVVYPVLVEPARVNPRWRAAGPQDPGVEFGPED
ncbi:hypothetical protein ABZ671_01650 [Micromonospora sp. NPDC006766]|uniref:hypothetical protein n=1 Tax=Micromonospora sp. NPDC006766 TaxID=3154778 RepID=UPI0033FFB573